MAEVNLTQPVEPLPTPEREALYMRLVREHHAGTRKFKSVASFHAAYLELGGTPRKKSVGKDRLMAGVPIGRKANRQSKKQRQAKVTAADNGNKRVPAGLCGTGRLTLEPSESKNNRHGMGGQASRAADLLLLNRGYTATQALTLRVGPGPSGTLWGSGRNFVKLSDRKITVVLRGAVRPDCA